MKFLVILFPRLSEHYLEEMSFVRHEKFSNHLFDKWVVEKGWLTKQKRSYAKTLNVVIEVIPRSKQKSMWADIEP